MTQKTQNKTITFYLFFINQYLYQGLRDCSE